MLGEIADLAKRRSGDSIELAEKKSAVRHGLRRWEARYRNYEGDIPDDAWRQLEAWKLSLGILTRPRRR